MAEIGSFGTHEGAPILFNIDKSASTAGIPVSFLKKNLGNLADFNLFQDCSPGQPTIMVCYKIDLNHAAVGAAEIAVTDVFGKSFKLARKFQDLSPGNFNLLLTKKP